MIDAYIEKELTEIVYKKGLFGRKIPFEKKVRYGFLFDMYCWLHMSDMEMISLTDLGTWDDATFIVNTCYYACISACKDRGAKITFSKDDIAYFLDKIPYNDFKEINLMIYKSRFMGKSLEDWMKEKGQSDTKKKSGQTILKTSQSQNLD